MKKTNTKKVTHKGKVAKFDNNTMSVDFNGTRIHFRNQKRGIKVSLTTRCGAKRSELWNPSTTVVATGEHSHKANEPWMVNVSNKTAKDTVHCGFNTRDDARLFANTFKKRFVAKQH